MRKSTAAPINWTLSLSRPDKLDQLLHIVEGVIVAADPFAMIDNTHFFVPCKAVQKLRLSVSFYKYRKSIWLDFRQQSFPACRFTVVTVCISMEHFRFSHQSLSGQSLELQPLQWSFSEQRQHARPHRAIPSSLFMPNLRRSRFVSL